VPRRNNPELGKEELIDGCKNRVWQRTRVFR
jgi:hypothetical protein